MSTLDIGISIKDLEDLFELPSPRDGIVLWLQVKDKHGDTDALGPRTAVRLPKTPSAIGEIVAATNTPLTIPAQRSVTAQRYSLFSEREAGIQITDDSELRINFAAGDTLVVASLTITGIP